MKNFIQAGMPCLLIPMLLAVDHYSISGKMQPNDKNAKYPPVLQMNFPPAAAGKQILITEFLPDPNPGAGLPEAEFFELYNPGDSTVYLQGWSWSDTRSSTNFGNDSIQAGEYLIVCHPNHQAAFSAFGRSIGLQPFPTLNNPGDHLQLSRPSGEVVDSLSYDLQWYRQRESDGISLERIGFTSPCLPKANWAASAVPAGGTPGKSSSLTGKYRDTIFTVQSIQLIDEGYISVKFNLYPEPVSALEPDNYQLNNGARVDEVLFSSDGMELRLHTAEPLRAGHLYRLRIKTLNDCYGHVLESTEKELLLPESILPGDIIINELLFNPPPGGADFVEIYNRSNKVLDLAQLGLSSADPDDSTAAIFPLSDSSALIYPGEFRLLSRYPEIVGQQYQAGDPATFMKMERLPAFPNKGGNCVLMAGKQVIDRLDYVEAMHSPLLVNKKGVSLERIHDKFPASREQLFRSAAASAGYATPGYRNSQFVRPEAGWKVLIKEPLFSPGALTKGKLVINYELPEGGLVANLQVYDARGNLVRHLTDNSLLGSKGAFSWDGRDDRGVLLNTGIYLIIMEVFSETGRVERFIRSCVLARKDEID